MGKRKREQQAAWVATTDLPMSPGHPFYQKLNRLLGEAGFDDDVEKLCRPHYADGVGRPGIAPGIYFPDAVYRLLRGVGFAARDGVALP